MIDKKDSIKLTTIVAGAIIFIAYIKQYLYYQYFNIDISNYVELSDMLTPFIDELAITTINLLFCGLLIVTFNIQSSNSGNTLSQDKKKRWLFIRFLSYLFSNFFIVLLMMIHVPMLWSIYFIYSNLYIVFSTLIYFTIFLLSSFILNESSGLTIELRNKHPYFVMLLILLEYVLVFNLYTNNFEILKKEYGEFKKYRYTFEMKDDLNEIKTDSLNIYVGRTKNHFFIYKKNENKTCVYNTSSIKREEIIKY